MTAKLTSRLPAFVDIRRDFLAGKASPVDLVQECLVNIARAEPIVQALVHLDAESSLHAAEASAARYRAGAPLSPIDGMPFSVKDIIDTKDAPTAMNSPAFAGHRPWADAAIVGAMRAGGAVMLGKTVTTEFAFGRPGATRNPHAPDHTPGGSSSGAAAGMAAGMAVVALATQTMGSILRPASFNGVVGFKPGIHRLSIRGLHPICTALDHPGTIAQEVETAWLATRWMSELAPGHDSDGIDGSLDTALSPLAPRTLGVLRPPRAFAELDGPSLAAFEAQIERIARGGTVIRDARTDPALALVSAALDDALKASMTLVWFELRWPYQDYVEAIPDVMPSRMSGFVAEAKALSRQDYLGARATRRALQVRVGALAAGVDDTGVDALAMPATSGPAPRGLSETGSRSFPAYWSFLGFPAFSLPVMTVDDLPFGLQLCGFDGGELLLARHALWITRLSQGNA